MVRGPARVARAKDMVTAEATAAIISMVRVGAADRDTAVDPAKRVHFHKNMNMPRGMRPAILADLAGTARHRITNPRAATIHSRSSDDLRSN